MNTAIADVQHEDERVRVTSWRFPPGTQTGWHRHELDYVVVPVKGGTLTVADASGSKAYAIETGVSYARVRGVEHNIVNETGAEIAFVEVELKTP